MKNSLSSLTVSKACIALMALTAPLTLCHAGTPIGSTPSPHGGYRAAIQTAYDQINSSFANNHLDRGCVFIMNDYRQVNPQGHAMDKVSTQQKFQSERNMIRTIHTQCAITGMNVGTDGVHVRMATHSAGTGVKRILFIDVKGTFTNDLRVNDLWVRTPAGWRLKSRVMLQDDSHLSRS